MTGETGIDSPPGDRASRVLSLDPKGLCLRIKNDEKRRQEDVKERKKERETSFQESQGVLLHWRVSASMACQVPFWGQEGGGNYKK